MYGRKRQEILETLHFLAIFGEPLNKCLTVLDEAGFTLQINALAAEFISVLEKALEPIVTMIQIIQQEILILDYLGEVIQPHALLVQLFDLVLREIINVELALDTDVAFELFDALLEQINIFHVDLEAVVVLLGLLRIGDELLLSGHILLFWDEALQSLRLLDLHLWFSFNFAGRGRRRSFLCLFLFSTERECAV